MLLNCHPEVKVRQNKSDDSTGQPPRSSPLPPTSNGASNGFEDSLDRGGGGNGGGSFDRGDVIACQKCTLENDRKLKVFIVLAVWLGVLSLLIYDFWSYSYVVQLSFPLVTCGEARRSMDHHSKSEEEEREAFVNNCV